MADACLVIAAGIFKRPLGIPADELVASTINPRIDRIPVVVVPIEITTPEVEHHVVDKIGDIDMLRKSIVTRLISDASIGDGVGLNPIGSGAIDDISWIGVERIPIFFLTSVIRRAKVGIRSFDRIIDPPIFAIEIEVEKGAVRRSMAHRELRVMDELIPEILGALFL